MTKTNLVRNDDNYPPQGRNSIGGPKGAMPPGFRDSVRFCVRTAVRRAKWPKEIFALRTAVLTQTAVPTKMYWIPDGMAPLGPLWSFALAAYRLHHYEQYLFWSFCSTNRCSDTKQYWIPESRWAWPPWTPYGVPSLWRIVVIISNKICFGHFALQTTVLPQNYFVLGTILFQISLRIFWSRKRGDNFRELWRCKYCEKAW